MQAPQGAFLLQNINVPLTVSRISFILRYGGKNMIAIFLNPRTEEEIAVDLDLPAIYSYQEYLNCLIAKAGKKVAYNFKLIEIF